MPNLNSDRSTYMQIIGVLALNLLYAYGRYVAVRPALAERASSPLRGIPLFLAAAYLYAADFPDSGLFAPPSNALVRRRGNNDYLVQLIALISSMSPAERERLLQEVYRLAMPRGPGFNHGSGSDFASGAASVMAVISTRGLSETDPLLPLLARIQAFLNQDFTRQIEFVAVFLSMGHGFFRSMATLQSIQGASREQLMPSIISSTVVDGFSRAPVYAAMLRDVLYVMRRQTPANGSSRSMLLMDEVGMMGNFAGGMGHARYTSNNTVDFDGFFGWSVQTANPIQAQVLPALVPHAPVMRLASIPRPMPAAAPITRPSRTIPRAVVAPMESPAPEERAGEMPLPPGAAPWAPRAG